MRDRQDHTEAKPFARRVRREGKDIGEFVRPYRAPGHEIAVKDGEAARVLDELQARLGIAQG